MSFWRFLCPSFYLRILTHVRFMTNFLPLCILLHLFPQISHFIFIFILLTHHTTIYIIICVFYIMFRSLHSALLFLKIFHIQFLFPILFIKWLRILIPLHSLAIFFLHILHIRWFPFLTQFFRGILNFYSVFLLNLLCNIYWIFIVVIQ